MGYAENTESAWQDYEQASETLQSALSKLQNRGTRELEEQYGFSGEFEDVVTDEMTALVLCERAMECLASQYVENLALFQDSLEATKALDYLEQSEVIWSAQSQVISNFDASGGETAFLEEIRETTMVILENKLADAASSCAKDASDENIALCIAIMAIMDGIYASKGFPKDNEQRLRLRKIVCSFR